MHLKYDFFTIHSYITTGFYNPFAFFIEGIEVISVGRKGVLEGGMGAHSSRSFSGALRTREAVGFEVRIVSDNQPRY